MRIGIARERKTPPDYRVPLIPWQCGALSEKYPDLEIVAESYEDRCYKNEEYQDKKIQIVDDLNDCDVICGVKEVPPEDLIPGKTYFFFSHTIKKQPYNRGLLQTILEKNIRLIDYECLRFPEDGRILGFGRYAGIVGAYNTLLAWGKMSGRYELKPANKCFDRHEVKFELTKVKLGPRKILLTGDGRVGGGALEVLKEANIEEVAVNEYLHKNFREPVFTQVEYPEYNRHKDGKPFDNKEFYSHPENFESDFHKFLPVTDMLIAGHYWSNKAPKFFTKEDMLKDDFNIRLIGDISCDIRGPIPSTVRASTINEPVYGYDPSSDSEVEPFGDNGVTVMAVDNLPCELPRDASEDFGDSFMNEIVPLLVEGDPKNILKNATIAEEGKLTDQYSYLQDYVDGKG